MKSISMKNNQFKIGVILAYLLVIINLIYGFFISPFLIKSLTSANYGAYKTISSLIGAVSVLDFGISSTVIRYLSKMFSEKDEQSSQSFLGMIFYQALLVALVILIVGIVLYFSLDSIYGNSDLGTNVDPGLAISKKLFILLLINTITNIPCSIFNAIIVAHKNYAFANLSKILRIVFQFVALIVVAPLSFWNGSTLSVGFVLIVTSSLFLLIDLFYVLYKIRIKINFKIKLVPKWIIKESLVFTFLSFIQTILVQFEGNIDNILIGKYISSEAVTTYSLAILFYSVFNQLSTAISTLLLPSVSQKIADGATNSDLEKLTIKVGRIQFMVLGGALFGFVACGRLFISLWVGDEQKLVWILGLILMTATLLPLVENTALAIIRAKNRILFRTIAMLIGAIFNFSITLLAVSLLNVDYNTKLILACIGTAISLVGANVIAMNLYYKKTLGFRPTYIFKSIFNKTLLCLIPPSIITFMFVLSLEASWICFLCAVTIFIIIYAFCLFTFGLSDEDKSILCGKFLVFTNHKEYETSDGKKLFLFPSDYFRDLSFNQKKALIRKEIKYDFKEPNFCGSNISINYEDNYCTLIDESNSNRYLNVNTFQKNNFNYFIVICHREFFKFYRQKFGVKPFFKSVLFSKKNNHLLYSQKKRITVKLPAKKTIKCAFISAIFACLSFGISYVTVDYSPEKISSYIFENYNQPVYCKMTPYSYPVNPYFSQTFYNNQASTPSFEYFYSQDYLNYNNSLFIFEKNENYSPIQCKINNLYVDSTFITSNYVSLNNESTFNKMGLNLLFCSNDYSDDDENVVAINNQLAVELFGSSDMAIDNTLLFSLYTSNGIKTSRLFKIVGVFEYTNRYTYYNYNQSRTLFVTNPKSISLGWNGFEYLFSMPSNLQSLDSAILKVLQIENTFKYSHSFFAFKSMNDETMNNITSELNAFIKNSDSSANLFAIVGITSAYMLFAFFFARETYDIRNNYFETISKRKICFTTCAVFVLLSLLIDFLLLNILHIYFVAKIVLFPIVACLILCFFVPNMLFIILNKLKK